jgi:hypothetical protein
LDEDLFILDRNSPFPIVLFRNAAARNAFRRWWKNYAARFGKVAPHDCFLPQFQSGPVSGVYVEHRLDIDHMAWSIRSESVIFRSADDLDTEMLRNVVPVWAWIIHHTRKRCWRVPSGWIFESKIEASKFVLCGRGKDLHPAEVAHV